MIAKPGFFERLSLALRVLGDPELAARVAAVSTAPALASEAARQLAPAEKTAEKTTDKTADETTAKPEKVLEVEKIVEVEKVVERIVEKHNPEAGALHMLSILQRDGRLIDFLLEDIGGAGDADVGAGARVVHAGCRKALQQYFTLEPVRKESEGAAVVVDKGFDPGQIRLAGNVSGEPPYRGRLTHGGWRAADVRLPERTITVDARVVAPAEVEI